MTINIQGTNFELTEAIKQRLNEKIAGALTRFESQIIHMSIEVEKTTRHHNKGELFRAEANVQTPGKLIRAESTHEDLYAAIEELKDKLERELVQKKEIFETRKRKEGRRARLMKSIFFWR